MLRRAFRDRAGGVAIEYAILAPMFVAVLLSTFEVGWLVAKSNLLDRALDKTIRQIRIGSASAPTTQAAMKTMICNNLYVVTNCSNALTIEMTRITGPTDYPSNKATCIDRGATVAPVVSFTSGARADIMYVRACLVTSAMTPYVGIALNFAKDSLGGYSIVSTSAYMNEPGD
jgi:Flp pilus assembly protein TadG